MMYTNGSRKKWMKLTILFTFSHNSINVILVCVDKLLEKWKQRKFFKINQQGKLWISLTFNLKSFFFYFPFKQVTFPNFWVFHVFGHIGCVTKRKQKKHINSVSRYLADLQCQHHFFPILSGKNCIVIKRDIFQLFHNQNPNI